MNIYMAILDDMVLMIFLDASWVLMLLKLEGAKKILLYLGRFALGLIIWDNQSTFIRQ